MPQPQDNARAVFLIILIFWLATSPDSTPGLIAGPSAIKSRLLRQRHALGVLNSTQWGDFSPRLTNDPPETEPKYLNLTGFREEDGYVWEDLQRFKNRCEEWSTNAVGIPEVAQPVWQNATGVVHGWWQRANTSSPRYHSSYNLSQISPDVTWAASNSDWSRNATGVEGKIMMRIEDNEDDATEPAEIDKATLEKVEVKAREVSATANIDDVEGTGSSWEMRLHGVHWPRQGTILLTTTSEKFAGIFGLPHLTTRPDFFESSQALLNRTLDAALRRKEQHTFTDQIDPWTSNSEPGETWNPSPHCEYLIYIQIYPPDQNILQVQPSLTGPENVAKAIQDIENELRFPQGTGHRRIPQLQMSAVVYSPDCAFFLETKGPPAYAPADGNHMVGVKQEIFLHSVSTFLLTLALIVFGQLQLLKMQMRETSTPSTLGRVSFYTGCMMLLADGMLFTGAAAWSFSASTTLLPSLAVTCVSFLSMTIGTFFLAEIHKVQEPEWRRQERERDRQSAPADAADAASPPNPSNNARETTTTSSTTTNTTRRPASPPIIIPSDQDIDAEIAEVTTNTTNNATLPAPVTAGPATPTAQNLRTQLSNIFGRLLLIGITVLFLSLAAASWRPSIRAAYFNIVLFIYLSLWITQIYRNVYRNCRRALSWRFVIGQSILRLLPIAYFYIVPNNFAFAEPDWNAFIVLAGWLWIQIWILAAQSVLGPRFGVPKGWMPEAWEYHPVLREDNIEAGGLPIGLMAAPSSPIERARTGEEGTSKDKRRPNIHVIDCAICREVLEVPVIRAGDDDPTAGGVAGVFARRAYMVTPCRHVFHSACLEGWMRFRLQCPICREELPPL
ncbi:transmembrane E3 ubiquitin-protein ligase [Daldinia grandis]|nr:transmembrane E3 ubiquitin-protein ligase [Daldinia grandis]